MTTLRQLEYLVKVAELASFTLAAEALHVSQPALSNQIAVLEREVGGRLFERLPRTVRLTASGRAMIPHAISAISEAQRGLTDARQAAGIEVGELDVAAVHSATLGLLPAPLSRWRLAHPNIKIRIHDYKHGDELAAAMRNGDADVAIGPTPFEWSGDISDLGEEEFVVVFARDDPLAEWRGPIQLAALADRHWVHFVPGHGLGDLLDGACANAGFSPLVALRVDQTATAPLLAAAGLGPTLVPASIIPERFDGLIFSTSPPTTRHMALYCRPNAGALTVAFSSSIASQINLMPAHVAARLAAPK
jgi:DNA-binding transcriptional LysR family regulator